MTSLNVTQLLGQGQVIHYSNQLKAFFFYKLECTPGAKARPPIHNLNCNLVCEDGEFLDIDIPNEDSTCKQCPANTFSVGGGILIDGEVGDWQNGLFPPQMEFNCYY